jgi:5'-methylthioadenosine phosphorylase
MMEESPLLGVIGGSGLYQMDGLERQASLEVDTPFGSPSAPLVVGHLDGHKVVFLARHGMGHTISPSEINYRANIYALKMAGVKRIIAISACGSLREDYSPGEIVLPDQVFDFTRLRKKTFFEDGCVGHISIAEPFCSDLLHTLSARLSDLEVRYHSSGAYITIEGPRFSTRAESNAFRAWGMSIIGMTTSPEAFLAREAEICYAVMSHVTDYDVWHQSEEPVTVEMVVRTLSENARLSQRVIRSILPSIAEDPPCVCQHALRDAIISDPASIPPSTRERLALLVDRYLS